MSEKLVDSQLLKKIERLKLNSNMILHLGSTGERKSISKGSSVEFSDFREYIPGDDFRKIDWNAYMRFEKLFLKLFVEEREAQINIIIDNTLSMDFGDKNKLFVAKQISCLLSYVTISGMDRVNINYLDNGKLKSSGFISGKNNFNKIVKVLDSIEPQSGCDLFQELLKANFKKGISIVLSDCFSENRIEGIKYLNYLKQDVCLIQILEKGEISPIHSGEVRLIDKESGEKVDVSISKAVLENYHKRYLDFVQEIKDVCNKYGNKHIVISSECSIDEILFDKLGHVGIIG